MIIWGSFQAIRFESNLSFYLFIHTNFQKFFGIALVFIIFRKTAIPNGSNFLWILRNFSNFCVIRQTSSDFFGNIWNSAELFVELRTFLKCIGFLCKCILSSAEFFKFLSSLNRWLILFEEICFCLSINNMVKKLVIIPAKQTLSFLCRKYFRISKSLLYHNKITISFGCLKKRVNQTSL